MKTWMTGGVLAAVVLLAGCEKTTTALVITVSPPDAQVEVGSMATFTASIPAADSETRKLYYPLVWTLGDDTLGVLAETVGDTAIYLAGEEEGLNTITVRDQAGAEGIARISQIEEVEETLD